LLIPVDTQNKCGLFTASYLRHMIKDFSNLSSKRPAL